LVAAAEATAADLSAESALDREEAIQLVKQADADRAEAARRAAELVEEAEARAAELSAVSAQEREQALTLVERAAADRAEAERRAAELVEQAQAAAAEVLEESRREHQEIAWSMEEARQQVERLSDQVQVATAEGARAMVDGLWPHVEDLRRQY